MYRKRAVRQLIAALKKSPAFHSSRRETNASRGLLYIRGTVSVNGYLRELALGMMQQSQSRNENKSGLAMQRGKQRPSAFNTPTDSRIRIGHRVLMTKASKMETIKGRTNMLKLLIGNATLAGSSRAPQR
jgi:hypothetical protein